jgi:hypothetical protein
MKENMMFTVVLSWNRPVGYYSGKKEKRYSRPLPGEITLYFGSIT